MTNNKVTGQCHCGAVKYTVQGKIQAFYCHCESCRLNTGAPLVAWGRVQENNFHLTQGVLKSYCSSEGILWFFCAECGTSIKYESHDSKPDIDFLLATLQSSEEIKPAYHIQVAEKLPWLEIADDLPQYARWRNSES